MSHNILNRMLGTVEFIGYFAGMITLKEVTGGLPPYTAPFFALAGTYLIGDGFTRLSSGKGCIAAYNDDKKKQAEELADAPAEMNIDGVVIREMQAMEQREDQEADAEPIGETVIRLNELYHSDVKPLIEKEDYATAYGGMTALSTILNRRSRDMLALGTGQNMCATAKLLSQELMNPNGGVQTYKETFEMYLGQAAMRAEALRKQA